MDYTAEVAEKAIAELEAERDKINVAIEGFRATLAKVRNGTRPGVSHSQAPQAVGVERFRRKHSEAPGDQIILALLREQQRPLTKNDAYRLLTERHYEYKPETVAFYLSALWQKGEEVERVDAPRGSGCSFAYRWREPKKAKEA
ncbi:MAG TPA: hypothetical protein VHR45_21860 [Thermoanaerobaculia bacterium]|nr:hypothetical protein [Thermoanaerobaculia bacterium]